MKITLKSIDNDYEPMVIKTSEMLEDIDILDAIVCEDYPSGIYTMTIEEDDVTRTETIDVADTFDSIEYL